VGSDLKFVLEEMELVQVNAYRTAEEWSQETKLEMARQTDVNVLDVRDNTVRVRLSEKVFFKPSGPFKIDLELEGKFRVHGTVPEPEEIEAKIEGVLYPLFAQASLIVSFISEKILGAPVIIPPLREED